MLADIVRVVRVEGRYLGAGYGHATEAGAEATAWAATHGLVLDPTYTAKACAAALSLVRAGTHGRVLYWHTLSSAPLDARVAAGPDEASLAPELRALFV